MSSFPSSSGDIQSDCKFRTISLQEALSFGVGVFFSHALIWGSLGLMLGVVHHLLLGFLSMGGGPLTLAERLLEALFLSAWPLAVSAEASTRHQAGDPVGLDQLFKVRHLFSVLLSMVSLALISLGGAMLLVQGFIWLFPGAVEPLSRSLLGPVSISISWSLLPILVMGGTCLGLPYSFGPFASLHEGIALVQSLERSRHLSRGLKIGLFFLQGFLFLVLCGGLYMFGKIPPDSTLGNHVLESLVIAGVASLLGSVWNHAYRQAVALDEEHPSLSIKAKRFHIPDTSFSIGDPTERTP